MTYHGFSNAPRPVVIDSTEPLQLSDQINASTRPTHSQLNRLIVDRLQLALPPYTTDASTYLTGLLRIAPIYMTFESLWQSIVNNSCSDNMHGIDSGNISITPDPGSKPKIAHHLRPWTRNQTILSQLQIPGLARSARLLADLQLTSHHSGQSIAGQLEEVSRKGALAKFLAHIKLSVGRNPHVLVAFAWVLYMAIFSGGRILRHSLQPIAGNISGSGLQFFEFDGNEDGEDIRRYFKKSFAEIEPHLSKEEKEDIVVEAQEIFKFMIEIVFDLDEVCRIGSNGQITLQQQESTTILLRTSTPLDKPERVMLQRERRKEKLELHRKWNLEIFGLIMALICWYCIHWWRYPSPGSVAVVALELSQSLD